jgi:riboflavin synthase
VFTGLVASRGEVVACERSEGGVRLRISAPGVEDLHEGDSVAVNGVCLTATAADATTFTAEVMRETLARSSLQDVEPGALVNLELPLRPGDRLGGHIVQGHVDGMGTIVAIEADGFARVVTIATAEELLRYVVEKGSIAVDGISLTVAAIDDSSFTVSLIPETLERTNLGAAQPGNRVNLEVDVLAKYVEKLVRR